MRFSILLLIAIAVFSVTSIPKADAADVTQALARMDAIIKEIQLLRAEFANLATNVPSTQSGAVLGASVKTVLTQSLAAGETNSDIKKIQKLLATDPEIYPYGVASGFFGPKTEEGIKNFQTRFNLDPVGVVGPATKTLLELFFAAYPDENYPADVLKKKPQVLGVSTSVPNVSSPSVQVPSVTAKEVDAVAVAYEQNKESKVKISYSNGTSETVYIAGDTKLKVVDAVATKTGQTRSYILGKIEFTTATTKSTKDNDFNVEVEIDGDETTVTFEFDGDEYEVQVDSTDEDDVLEEVADELDEDVEDIDEDLKDAIEDALEEALDKDKDDEGDSEEIDSITARVADGEAEIEVEFGDGSDDSFTVKEDLESKIIEEVADELNIDEDEVEDLIEFEYEDIDGIEVEIKNGKALAFVTFEDGTEKRVRISSDDEDEIIEALADELDEDESDIEDLTEFDYLD